MDDQRILCSHAIEDRFDHIRSAIAIEVETPVVIVTPMDGAVVPPRFSVEITYGTVWYGDTDDTGDAPADTVELWADDDILLVRCSPCSSPDEAFFDVELPPGEHTLSASAWYLSAPAYSEPITIVVAEEKDEGCACDSARAPESGLVWLGVACLALRRRRR